MNSKQKGDLAVAKAIAYYMESGNEVLLPIGDKRPYDLVIEIKNKLKKVQCKYTSSKTRHGRYQAPLRVMGGNQSFYKAKSYKKGDFDMLFVLTSDGDLYEIPSSITDNLKTCIVLGEKCKDYKVMFNN